MTDFDVFLAHNSADKGLVRVIATRLRDRGVTPWLDEWELVPGEPWQRALARGIATSLTSAVFIGPAGIGSWEDAEAMLILDRAVRESSYRVIPVLLPGAPDPDHVRLPEFASLFTRVDFRDGIDRPEPLERLIAGVQGKAPGPAPAQDRAVPGPTALMPYLRNLELQACLAALDVAENQLDDVAAGIAAAVARNLKTGRDADYSTPDAAEVPTSNARVSEFLEELLTYLLPERLLATTVYVSDQKINQMYRAYRPALQVRDNDDAANITVEEKFLRLHRFLSERGRLVFAPSRLLLGQPLSFTDDSWTYFVGEFRLKLDEAALETVPGGSAALKATNPSELYGLVSRLFGSPDPFFYPFVTFQGALGSQAVAITVSRKYLRLESMTASALTLALLGTPVTLAGFGALQMPMPNVRQVQPVACRLSFHHDWLDF